MRNLNEHNGYRIKKIGKIEIVGDEHKGVFEFACGLTLFHVIAGVESRPDGSVTEHVTFYPYGKYGQRFPTWEEICWMRDLFFLPGEKVEMTIPTAAETSHNTTYHLELYRNVSAENTEVSESPDTPTRATS